MGVSVGVAALLVPLHHKLEQWVRNKLAKRFRRVNKQSKTAKSTQPVTRKKTTTPHTQVIPPPKKSDEKVK